MLGAEFLKQQQNFTAYSPKYEQAQLYHHASDPQRVNAVKCPNLREEIGSSKVLIEGGLMTVGADKMLPMWSK